MKSVRVYRYILIIILLFISSCGFQLRGTGDFKWHIQSVHIQSEFADRIANEVKYRLTEEKIEVLPTRESAQVVVSLYNETVASRILSVSAISGKQAEIELNYRVEIQITKPDDTVLLERRSISFLRDYGFDPTAVLAAGGEEAILREDMFNQIVMQVIRHLHHIKITEENQK